MLFHERKNPRIPGYDYSKENFYFITICTSNKKCIFGSPNYLNKSGMIADEYIQKIPEYYPNVLVDKYVVMPNHVHIILYLTVANNSKVSQIVGQYKMAVSKAIRAMAGDISVWQRSFYDHVIRNEKRYLKIWEYIDNNPAKWETDCFYQTE